jgi:hypothetical protein
MTLGQKLVDRLNALDRLESQKSDLTKPTGEDCRYVIDEEIDGIGVRAEIQDFDKFSYIVKTFTITRPQTQPLRAPVKELLLRQAGEIERRISYLLESFGLIELDEVNSLAQVRSATPHMKEEKTFYYEVLLRQGHGLTFARYYKERQSEKRQAVPCHLTQETFERLVEDLAATLRLN